MTSIDEALDQLVHQPIPTQLASLEAQVWQRVAITTEPAWGWRLPATAMAVALAVGMVAGMQPVRAVDIAEIDALSVRPALLPSTLLVAS